MKLNIQAPAKINISLDVTGRRADGYHLVCMVMQTIGLADRLTLEKTACPGVHLTITGSDLPADGNNLICRAGHLLIEEFGLTEGVDVVLEKNIPIAAGLAGGSTDAAATLIGMNQLFGLGLSKQELMERGVKIGADVPYCILQGTALAEGIGEKLTPLPRMIDCPVLIAKPPIAVSTPFVYKQLDLQENPVHPDTAKILADMKAGDLDALCADMSNILEGVTAPIHPVIREIEQQMMDAGAAGAMMSGSGPTVFGLFRDLESAQRAYDAVKAGGLAPELVLTRILNVPETGEEK